MDLFPIVIGFTVAVFVIFLKDLYKHVLKRLKK